MYGYCLRCGKKLKKREYKLIGYGPECLKKKNKSKKPLFRVK